MKECHHSKWTGHLGMHRTLVLVGGSYYWPHLKVVRTCIVCQQDKVEQGAPTRLLKTRPAPELPWKSVSMDFIMRLPKSEGCS